MELEIINKLFLELSQIATAKTKRELELEEHLKDQKDAFYNVIVQREKAEKELKKLQDEIRKMREERNG